MIRLSRKARARKKLYLRQNGKCYFCKLQMEYYDRPVMRKLDPVDKLWVCTIDHLKDNNNSLRRSNKIEDLVASHNFCNFLRSYSILRIEKEEDFKDRLIKETIRKLKEG